MSELAVKVLIGLVAVTFAFVSLRVVKPDSGGGKLSLKLCIVNVAGWLLMLPLSTTGHPPPFVMALFLFWLINIVLLPAAAIALWVAYKEGEERRGYLAVASTYVVMNLIVLFVVPITLLYNPATLNSGVFYVQVVFFRLSAPAGNRTFEGVLASVESAIASLRSLFDFPSC